MKSLLLKLLNWIVDNLSKLEKYEYEELEKYEYHDIFFRGRGIKNKSDNNHF